MSRTSMGNKTTKFYVDSRGKNNVEQGSEPLSKKKADFENPKATNSKPSKQPGMTQNLDFYRNRIRSQPAPGNTIDEMLKWKGNYQRLESNHRYIQWLFPIPDHGGMNPKAQALQQYEIKFIRDSKQCTDRLVAAYEMMLDFYGIRLVSRDTGEVERTKMWKSRFNHLNKSIHNYFRITRILKCLGCLGFVKFQKPLVQFLLNEILVERTLPDIRYGALLHWIGSLYEEDDQRECYQQFQESQNQFTEELEVTGANKIDGHHSDRSDEPDKNKDESTEEPNLLKVQSRHMKFYRNEIKYKGRTIEEILELKDDFKNLDKPEKYITRLLPICIENGSGKAEGLQPDEAKAIQSDAKLLTRGLKAYEIVLDYYGMKLDHQNPGKVKTINWKDRSSLLCSEMTVQTFTLHGDLFFNPFKRKSNEDNFKTITRMLQSMRHIGLQDYQLPLVEFLMKEVFETKAIVTEIETVRIWIEMLESDQELMKCYNKLFEEIGLLENGDDQTKKDILTPNNSASSSNENISENSIEVGNKQTGLNF